MSPVGSALFVLWLLAAGVSMACIRDLLSPDKLVLAVLGLFFSEIFFAPHQTEVYAAYAMLLLAFVAAVIIHASAAAGRPRWRIEAGHGGGSLRPLPSRASFRGHALMWALSLPAIAAQQALIMHFGGLVGYINVLALRVVEFQGLGWLTSIIQTFAVVDLLYYGYLATRKSTRVADWLSFLLHLSVFVVIALLTGSRGSLLVNFVLLAILRHHLVRPMKVRHVLAIVASTMVVASVLEVAREGVAFGDEGLTTGLSPERGNEQAIGYAWASYGTLPLRLVLEGEVVKHHMGLTYATWFTNAVPRAFWPDKPDTGGVVLTKEYTGDAWGGSSHLSTGILPEAIINFGQAGGLAVGVLQFTALMLALMALRVRLRRRLHAGGEYRFVDAIRFAYLSWSVAALLIGEFTNVMLTLTVQLLALWLLAWVLRTIGLQGARLRTSTRA